MASTLSEQRGPCLHENDSSIPCINSPNCGHLMLELTQEWLDWQMISRQFARQQGMPLIAGIPDRFECGAISATGSAAHIHLLAAAVQSTLENSMQHTR